MSILSPFSMPGEFRKGNLHTHSTLSDGQLLPSQVIERYKLRGYDFLVLSEHFLGRFDWPIADTKMYCSDNFVTIPGAELHAPKTQVGEYWHILATGLPEDFEPARINETGAQLARRAAKAGAFISIAHPEWSQLTMEDGISIDAAHAVEIYNHGCHVESDRGYGWVLMDQLLNENHRLTAIATDDAHFAYGEFDAFGGWVQVKSENLDPDGLLESLKAGNFYASQGPQFHNLQINGSLLSIECSPVDNVIVVSGTSRTTNHFGNEMTHMEINLDDLKKNWFLEKPSQWFRVIIVDAFGNKAWTNPYWFEDLN